MHAIAWVPYDETPFEELTVERVLRAKDGAWLVGAGDVSYVVPLDAIVEPQKGMQLRVYSNGPGTPVRTLLLDGTPVYPIHYLNYRESPRLRSTSLRLKGPTWN